MEGLDAYHKSPNTPGCAVSTTRIYVTGPDILGDTHTYWSTVGSLQNGHGMCELHLRGISTPLARRTWGCPLPQAPRLAGRDFVFDLSNVPNSV